MKDEPIDKGGVPTSLAHDGYRSVNPIAVFGAVALLVAVVAWVLWAVIAPRPSAAATAPQSIATPMVMEQTQPLIANPAPESLGKPRSHPAFALATSRPSAAPQTATTAAAVAYAPLPAAAPVTQDVPRVKTSAEMASEARDARYASAGRGNSRMSLETQDAQAERDLRGATPVTAGASGPNTAFAGDPHETFAARQAGEPGYVPATSRYELANGTIIACRLITTVDSTIPGGIMLAQVVNDVYDSATHSVVVIPAGSRAVGRADSALLGEARLASSWTEFDLPNGRRFFASSNQGAGAKGEAGMSASVDNHAGRSFGSGLIQSIIRAGTNLASRSTTVIDVGSGTTVAQQPLGPTLHAYAGQTFSIILSHDLPLDRYVP